MSSQPVPAPQAQGSALPPTPNSLSSLPAACLGLPLLAPRSGIAHQGLPAAAAARWAVEPIARRNRRPPDALAAMSLATADLCDAHMGTPDVVSDSHVHIMQPGLLRCCSVSRIARRAVSRRSIGRPPPACLPVGCRSAASSPPFQKQGLWRAARLQRRGSHCAVPREQRPCAATAGEPGRRPRADRRRRGQPAVSVGEGGSSWPGRAAAAGCNTHTATAAAPPSLLCAAAPCWGTAWRRRRRATGGPASWCTAACGTRRRWPSSTWASRRWRPAPSRAASAIPGSKRSEW